MQESGKTSPTVDPLEELKWIREQAKRTRERIAGGRAVNGVGGLHSIEKRAEDALRWNGVSVA